MPKVMDRSIPTLPVLDMALKRITPSATPSPFARLMHEKGARQIVKPGTTIFIEGDNADTLFHVVSGVVRCCHMTMDGRRQIAQFLMYGNEMGLTAIRTYAYTAEAVGEVVVQRMTRAAFERAVREDASLRDALFEHMAETLASSRGRMVLLGKLNAAERAASFLIEMGERTKEPQGDIRLAMNRQDIADYLGMTLETVSRMFNRFRKEGLIAMTTPDCIHIEDRAGLECMASAS